MLPNIPEIMGHIISMQVYPNILLLIITGVYDMPYIVNGTYQQPIITGSNPNYWVSREQISFTRNFITAHLPL